MKPKDIKLHETYKNFAHLFVTDPLHRVTTAARKMGRSDAWGVKTIRRPAVRAYIKALAGNDPEQMRAPQGGLGTQEAVATVPIPTEGQAVAVREAEIVDIPKDRDAMRAFEVMRLCMGANLVDLLTDEGALDIDETKVRALKGTPAKITLKRLHRQQRDYYNNKGEKTMTVTNLAVEMESPLAAALGMAKCLGIDGGDAAERSQRAMAFLEAIIEKLPPSVVKEVHLALLEHGGALLDRSNGHPAG